MPESSRRTDAPLSRALTLARDVLADAPAGIATDIDGTLSPIVDDPDAAALAPGAAAALAGLARRVAVVAAVTGRAAADARRILGTDAVLVAGNHGVEWLEPGLAGSSVATDIRVRLDEALAAVPSLDGMRVEDKGLSATIHYRAAADPAHARAMLLDALGALGGVDVREGRMSVELRLAGIGDKGAAVRSLVERFGLRGLVVLGDDVTDLDMFAAAASLRDAGRLRAAIIGVGGGGEVPASVAEAADIVLRDPDEIVRLLTALA